MHPRLKRWRSRFDVPPLGIKISFVALQSLRLSEDVAELKLKSSGCEALGAIFVILERNLLRDRPLELAQFSLGMVEVFFR
jgi:hypothetical protein